MSTLVSPLSPQAWRQTLHSTDSHDKLLRLLQYLFKIFPHSSLRTFSTSLATSRQVWRLFKWISIPFPTGTSSISEGLRVLNDLLMFGYYVFDNITLLYKTGMLKGNVASSARRAARFWFAAILCGLMSSLLRIIHLEQKQRRLQEELEQKQECKKEYFSIQTQKRIKVALCTKQILDLVIATNLSTVSKPIRDEIIGGCGTISSMIALWKNWPRHE